MYAMQKMRTCTKLASVSGKLPAHVSIHSLKLTIRRIYSLVRFEAVSCALRDVIQQKGEGGSEINKTALASNE
jgi:hypothetical protein